MSCRTLSVLYVVTVQGHTVCHHHCTWLCLRDLAGGDLSSAGCFSSRWDGTTPSTSKRNPVVRKAKGCENCFWMRINLIEKNVNWILKRIEFEWVAVISEDNPFQFNFCVCKNKKVLHDWEPSPDPSMLCLCQHGEVNYLYLHSNESNTHVHPHGLPLSRDTKTFSKLEVRQVRRRSFVWPHAAWLNSTVSGAEGTSRQVKDALSEGETSKLIPQAQREEYYTAAWTARSCMELKPQEQPSVCCSVTVTLNSTRLVSEEFRGKNKQIAII